MIFSKAKKSWSQYPLLPDPGSVVESTFAKDTEIRFGTLKVDEAGSWIRDGLSVAKNPEKPSSDTIAEMTIVARP